MTLLDQTREKLTHLHQQSEALQTQLQDILTQREAIPAASRATDAEVAAETRSEAAHWRFERIRAADASRAADIQLARRERRLRRELADVQRGVDQQAALVADLEAREALVLPDLTDAEKLNYLIGRYPSVINDPKGESCMTTSLVGDDQHEILWSYDGLQGWLERPITAEEKIALALFYAGYRVWVVSGQYPTSTEEFDFCRRAEPLAQYTEWGRWSHGTHSRRYFLVKTPQLEASERGVDVQIVLDERQARLAVHDAALERARAERQAAYLTRCEQEKAQRLGKREAMDKAEAARQQAIDAALVALGYTRDETPTRMSVKGTWVSPSGDSVNYHRGYFELIALAKKEPVAAGKMVVSYRHGNLSITEAVHG